MFRIDILDSSGTKLGGGPLTNITALNDTRRLDAIGELTFSLPAADPRARFITAGALFDVYDQVDGYLGRFVYQSRSTEQRGGEAVLTVETFDALRELSHHTVGFRRTYTYQDVAAVITDLVTAVDDWTVNCEDDIGHTTISYEGESVLIAVDALRDRWGRHYRLQSTDPAHKVLEFGSFGQASGVRLVKAGDAVPPDIDSHSEIAFVENIRLIEEAAAICNRLIPLGAGQGVSQLTIEQATLGDYAVHGGTNADGSPFYYIEDAASVAAYGVRERILSLPNIRPLTNSAANLVNAANALKLTAEYYLQRHTTPQLTYGVQVRGLRQALQPGDTVRLSYVGLVEGYAYIAVDQDFYVMDITRRRRANGDRIALLEISTVAARRTSDTDIMLDIMHDLNALKVHVPITLAYAPVGPYTQRLDSSVNAEFAVRIKDEVTALNRALLAFKTDTLKSSVKAVGAAESSVGTTGGGGGTVGTTGSGGGTTATSSSGGGSTATSAGGGDHRHVVFGGLSSPPSCSATNIYAALVKAGGNTYSDAVALTSSTGRTQPQIETWEASGDHTHQVTIPAHTHQVTVPDHRHDVTIPDHSHSVTIPEHDHDMEYGLYRDDQYPQDIHLMIDGIDRTAELGGPWAPSNAGIEVELDITDYLVEAAGGLRQTHNIVFSCNDGRGELRAEVDLLVSIQAIAVG